MRTGNCWFVTQYERILEELAPLVKAGRLQTVFSPDSEKGISYTIRAGIEAAEKQNADACACLRRISRT